MSTLPTPEIPYTALVGQVLAVRRQNLGLQQNVLAHALGISQSAYSRIEQGKTSLSIPQLRIVADVLYSSPSEILAQAESQTALLAARGVAISDEKNVSPAALLIGLGILAAIIASTSK